MWASRSRSCSRKTAISPRTRRRASRSTYDMLPAAADCREPRAPMRRRCGASFHRTSSRPTGSPMARSMPPSAARPMCCGRNSSSHRGAAHSIEGRGILAEFRRSDGSLTVWASTQKAHDLFNTLAQLLGLDDKQLRVGTPDVGGGFGPKICVYPEDVAVAAAAKLLERSVKWIEDRREHFLDRGPGARPALGDGDRARRRTAASSACAARCCTTRAPMRSQDVNLPYNSATALTGPYMVPAFAMEVAVADTNKMPVILGARRRLSAGLVHHGAPARPRCARASASTAPRSARAT